MHLLHPQYGSYNIPNRSGAFPNEVRLDKFMRASRSRSPRMTSADIQPVQPFQEKWLSVQPPPCPLRIHWCATACSAREHTYIPLLRRGASLSLIPHPHPPSLFSLPQRTSRCPCVRKFVAPFVPYASCIARVDVTPLFYTHSLRRVWDIFHRWLHRVWMTLPSSAASEAGLLDQCILCGRTIQEASTHSRQFRNENFVEKNLGYRAS